MVHILRGYGETESEANQVESEPEEQEETSNEENKENWSSTFISISYKLKK